MGEVYRARDPKLQREVAIKALLTITPNATATTAPLTIVVNWPELLRGSRN